MKLLNLFLLAFLLASICVLPGCDYVTGKKPDDRIIVDQQITPLVDQSVAPLKVSIDRNNDWKLVVSNTDLKSLFIDIGVIPNDRVSKVDISALAELRNLTYLKIQSRSIIEDLSPIATLDNLTTLELSIDRAWTYDPPLDILPLESLRNLTSLTIISDDFKSLNISLSPKLVSLSITVEKGPVTFDLGSLVDCTNLKELKLKCAIKGTDTFSALTRLQSLDLSDNDIIDISHLSKCKNISILNLGNNSISDITSLSSLPNLDTLNLQNNKITDISPVSLLTKLSSLDLQNNQIPEISSLASLTNLKILKLSHNLIEDVSALVFLKNLSSIWLGANKVKNITSLSKLPNLREVLLDGNPIDNVYIDEVTSLRQKGVTVYYSDTENYNEYLPLLFSGKEKTRYYHFINPEMSLDEIMGFTYVSNYTEIIQYITQRLTAQGLDASKLLEILFERNTKSIKMDIPSNKEAGYIIDYDGVFNSYMKRYSLDGWEKIREDFPDFRGYISISVPVFDPIENMLVVYMSWGGGSLAGTGDILVFRYENGNLTLLGGVNIWVS
jgi:internalin A